MPNKKQNKKCNKMQKLKKKTQKTLNPCENKSTAWYDTRMYINLHSTKVTLKHTHATIENMPQTQVLVTVLSFFNNLDKLPEGCVSHPIKHLARHVVLHPTLNLHILEGRALYEKDALWGMGVTRGPVQGRLGTPRSPVTVRGRGWERRKC